MKKLFNILLFLTYLIILFCCLEVTFQNDTFYTIKIGQDILNFGIDMKDHYSWIIGLSYTYPHWLFDLIVGIIYNFSGFIGVYLFTYLMYFLVGLSLYICFRKLKYNNFLSYVIMLITVILLRHFAACRAQIVSYILIIWFYYNLICLIKNNSVKHIIYMFIISILVANLHVAVWPFLFVLFLPYLAEFIIYKLKDKFKFLKAFNLSFNNMNIKLLIITIFICLIAGLCTPLGLTPFTYIYNTFIGNTQYYISEHQPIVFWNRFLLICYIFSLIIVLKNKKLYLSDIFLILGLTIMMLSSNRHVSLFVILSIFIFIKYFDIKKLDFFKLNKFNNYKYFKNVVGIAIIIFLVWYPCISININKINHPFVWDSYHVDAINFIKNNMNYKNFKIYNTYESGAYLLFNDIKVMFDSRADLYTKEFNGKYEYFTEFMELDDNYKDIFSKYGISYILISPDSQLSKYLSNDFAYEVVYRDKESIIYVDKLIYEDIMKK